MWGRLARSETIQGVERKPSDERQAAAVNTTTILERDQILDLCEMIHTSRSGNLPVAGSRVLGLFRCIQVTLLTLRHRGLFIGVFWLSPTNALSEGDVGAACPI